MKKYSVEIEEVDDPDEKLKIFHVKVDINPHEFKFLPEVRKLIGDKGAMMYEIQPGGIFRIIMAAE